MRSGSPNCIAKLPGRGLGLNAHASQLNIAHIEHDRNTESSRHEHSQPYGNRNVCGGSVFYKGTMEEIRDYNGQLICTADGQTGMIERMTTKEHIIIILPERGKFAYETRAAYTEIERVSGDTFYVTSYPNN